jgi:integrase
MFYALFALGTFQSLWMKMLKEPHGTIFFVKEFCDWKFHARSLPLPCTSFTHEPITFMGSAWKDQNLVFPSSIGIPLQAGYPEKTCKRIYAAINLGGDFTFHNLRHTAASIMLKNGMSLIEVSKYLGHSSPSITAEIYAHVMPGGLEKAPSIFDGLISAKG